MVVDYETARRIINQYVSDVKEVLPINKVYLYGSYANGTAQWDSDVDICFFSDSFTTQNSMNVIGHLYKLKRKYNKDLCLEPNAFPLSELNNDNPFVKEILRTGIEITSILDDKEKRDNLSEIRANLDEISQIIAKTVPVESIYLFGSYAYGTPNKDSDLDLFVVFKDEMEMRELDAITAISMAIYPKKKMSMDIIGLKQNRFLIRKMYATLERKIEREGVKLYG